MHKTITTLLALLMCSSIYAAGHSDPEPRSVNSNGRIKPPLAPLTVLCFSSTPGSITLIIRAGTTGAPAGFSGRVPWCSNYDLTPDAEVQISISDALIDACGASNECNTPLDCNMAYVFRAFAHGNNQFHRGPFSYGSVLYKPMRRRKRLHLHPGLLEESPECVAGPKRDSRHH